MIKKILSSKQAKIVVDILLIAGLILSFFSPTGAYWASLHCVVCTMWFLAIGIHIWQHWNLTKAFTKTKVVVKNKITALTIACFILMAVSISQFAIGLEIPHFHNFIGHLFYIIVIIHTIQKLRRFIALFKRDSA